KRQSDFRRRGHGSNVVLGLSFRISSREDEQTAHRFLFARHHGSCRLRHGWSTRMNKALAPPRAREWLSQYGPRVFVFAIWLLMTFLAARHIVRYGRNVPMGDDFALVPYWTGNKPVTITYLWEQHNEHRVPFYKIMLLSLGWLTKA